MSLKAPQSVSRQETSRDSGDYAPWDYVPFDRELDGLPADLLWREWMGRIEAALFASSSPVDREDLQKLVGESVSIEMLINDIEAELKPRPYELVFVAGGWVFRTKVRFADAIKAAADLGERALGFPRWRWRCCVQLPITSRLIVQVLPTSLARKSAVILSIDFAI